MRQVPPKRSALICLASLALGAAITFAAPAPSASVRRDILAQLAEGKYEVLETGRLTITELTSLLWDVTTSYHGPRDAEMETKIATAIGKTPGLTEFYVDAIEDSLSHPNSQRFHYTQILDQLAEVGTAETIHLLGQYLDDQRPEQIPEPPIELGVEAYERWTHLNPPKIKDSAGMCLFKWLAESGRVNVSEVAGAYVAQRPDKEIPFARTWWNSPAASDFRDWKPSSSSAANSPNPNPASTASGKLSDALPSAWVIAVIAAGLSAAVLLAARRHRSR